MSLDSDWKTCTIRHFGGTAVHGGHDAGCLIGRAQAQSQIELNGLSQKAKRLSHKSQPDEIVIQQHPGPLSVVRFSDQNKAKCKNSAAAGARYVLIQPVVALRQVG
jgi:hypothetical protein